MNALILYRAVKITLYNIDLSYYLYTDNAVKIYETQYCQI